MKRDSVCYIMSISHTVCPRFTLPAAFSKFGQYFVVIYWMPYMVVQRLPLLPHTKKHFWFKSQLGSFCLEFACCLCTCVGSLRVLQLLQTVQKHSKILNAFFFDHSLAGLSAFSCTTHMLRFNLLMDIVTFSFRVHWNNSLFHQ